MTDNQESIVNKEENLMDESPFLKLKRWQWWLLVAINIFFLIAGQAAAVLLGRFYYDKGGNSKWMATLVQTAGFPVLCIPWFLLHPSREASTSSTSPSIKTLALLYFVLGVLVAGDNMLYSEMQIYTSVVASCLSTIGLFASGEWKSLQHEMEVFGTGRVSYVLTLVWTAITWQVCAVGVVGLIFVVSSLFSNVISTLSLAVTPLAALVVFHDKMNGVKVIAMLLALCGFASYIYQNYIDDKKARRLQTHVREIQHTA
ncbi:hypothetical protein E1A91_D12G114800v1 [Gossypium mustelinum]|uniref:Purine permease n=1 Tax=Gossypium mustelinum TaxID=34275 RepID=A0A5D2SEA6_GOSMU|nr:hypothetical protein E1A91_D12G114800v1 [Gossypium mustelinum]